METMITTETKVRIFAQYLGQKVVSGQDEFNLFSVRLNGRLNKNRTEIDKCQLILKPLSAITDDDAIEVANIEYNGRLSQDHKKDIYNGKALVKNMGRSKFPMQVHTLQYLQSKGYALPFMEYSVEDLVKAGIYKLEE